MDIIESFKKAAADNGWNYKEETNRVNLSDHPILKNYKLNEHPLFCEFITYFSSLSNQENSKWFLCAKDYIVTESENEFAWDEFRRISVENAYDEEQRGEIEKFWKVHLPFLMSVAGGYSYWALELESGKIVSGFEPMFEEVTIEAKSFEDFLKKVISGKISL